MLLTVITGKVNVPDDAAVPPKITEEMRADFGEKVVERFWKITTFNRREQ